MPAAGALVVGTWVVVDEAAGRDDDEPEPADAPVSAVAPEVPETFPAGRSVSSPQPTRPMNANAPATTSTRPRRTAPRRARGVSHAFSVLCIRVSSFVVRPFPGAPGHKTSASPGRTVGRHVGCPRGIRPPLRCPYERRPPRRHGAMTTALYAGSFDPFHRGHRTIVEHAARAFDAVIVAILANPAKPSGLLTAAARAEVVARSVTDLATVTVVIHHGLVADLARRTNATAFVRSMGKEQAFELQMALHNQTLADVPTVFFAPAAHTASISSTEIRARLARDDTAAALELLVPSARSTFTELTAPRAAASGVSAYLHLGEHDRG